MTKTVSVGLVDDAKINYISFLLHNKTELSFFCEDLAEYIINKYSKYFLHYIIHKNYGYFNKSDKASVFEIARKAFSNIYSGNEDVQKSFIQKKLYNYFIEEQTDTIILEGFVQFRLLNCFEELEWLVDSAVDEFLIQKEYESFIAMLKQFVSIQAPLVRQVHIQPEPSGRYALCDENFEALTESQILGLGQEEVEGYVTEDDLLLSALISLAPKKIIIHSFQNFKNKQLYETIQKVFSERVTVCTGCKICTKNIYPIQIKNNL